MQGLRDLWAGAPPLAQDVLVLALLLLPPLILGAAVLRGHSPAPLTLALLRRFRWTNLVFVCLMAVSVGLGAALIAQERAVREGSARAAAPFDVIVAAPGDEIRMLLAAVYLQPSSVPLLGPEVLSRLQSDPRISLLAPIAFGDSVAGDPVVGTAAALVEKLGGVAEGRLWQARAEAVIGAASPLAIGDEIEPAHGHGDAAEADAHEGAHLTVVGRMAETGGPWDRAILVPVEYVWEVHGLASGHPPGDAALGPPYDPAHFPGVPAFVAGGARLADAYAIRAAHDRADSMAFFPGATLSRLHALLGDVREAMSLMAFVTQALAAAGVLAGLVALARLFARRFALLRALGAPRRFILAVVWSYAAALLGAGCLLGLAAGWVAAGILSTVVAGRTGIPVTPALGWPELHLVAAVFAITSLLALFPAIAAYRRPAVEDLRAG